MNDDRLESEEKGQDRDEHGRFLKGHSSPGPGRPPGSVDLLAICQRRADEEGIDLEQLVWEVAQALFRRAEQGDVAAAKLVLDRLCGPVGKGSNVAVAVNQVSALPPGPPVPSDQELEAQLEELLMLSRDHGMFRNLEIRRREPNDSDSE
ncbi:MAG: hypothetical protein H6834_10550 [Planctomycetes bacterium]|nr:hypothetical protein [Planctomycetota bacterium]